ncbi:MAG: ParB N-terminal domain-containing protein [Chloroflexi bacterium]|nr:ParB N-terminal domain-containing protein [Chloroflexota bacterium]
MPKSIGLGRGLASLIPGADESANPPASSISGLMDIAVGDIRPNPHQPRLTRGVEAMQLEELAASIREHGVIQPLIVTRTTGLGATAGAPYTLIAGERRWRATGRAAPRAGHRQRGRSSANARNRAGREYPA